jgi:hypothetical protein
MDAQKQRKIEEMAQVKDGAFAEFIAQPMTRLGMSQIPPGDHQDTLRLLLRAAFDHGFGNGQADVLGDMVKHMIKHRKED